MERNENSDRGRRMVATGTLPQIEVILEQWPEEPRESARRLIEHYGPPQEYTETQLCWRETPDGWKRTVLSREEVPHAFPSHHTDFLEQFVDYGEKPPLTQKLQFPVTGRAGDPDKPAEMKEAKSSPAKDDK